MIDASGNAISGSGAGGAATANPTANASSGDALSNYSDSGNAVADGGTGGNSSADHSGNAKSVTSGNATSGDATQSNASELAQSISQKMQVGNSSASKTIQNLKKRW